MPHKMPGFKNVAVVLTWLRIYPCDDWVGKLLAVQIWHLSSTPADPQWKGQSVSQSCPLAGSGNCTPHITSYRQCIVDKL